MNAVRSPGGARVGDLARATGTSTMTIRRDLAELERQGMLRRTHGGAVSLPARGAVLPFAMRLGTNIEQKHRIAAHAADLIPDGASVIIDTGTTCTTVAQALAGRDLTVLALSVHAAAALGDRPGTRIVTPGGQLDADELAWTGHRAVHETRAFRADFAILGVCAWDETTGLTASTPHDADLKKAIIDSSQHVFACATSDKIGTTATFAGCSSERIHTLVTHDLAGEAEAWLAEAGVGVVDLASERGPSPL